MQKTLYPALAAVSLVPGDLVFQIGAQLNNVVSLRKARAQLDAFYFAADWVSLHHLGEIVFPEAQFVDCLLVQVHR
jgi:hypothetical protein